MISRAKARTRGDDRAPDIRLVFLSRLLFYVPSLFLPNFLIGSSLLHVTYSVPDTDVIAPTVLSLTPPSFLRLPFLPSPHPSVRLDVSYENQIGIVHEYRASQGKLSIYYYNLAGAPLTEFKVDIPVVSLDSLPHSPFPPYSRNNKKSLPVLNGSRNVVFVRFFFFFSRLYMDG